MTLLVLLCANGNNIELQNTSLVEYSQPPVQEKKTMAGRQGTVHMTFAQAVAVGEAIKKVCRKVGETAEYDAGHDDESVSVLCGVTLGQVAKLRLQIVGPIAMRAGGVAASMRALEARMAILEAKFEEWLK